MLALVGDDVARLYETTHEGKRAAVEHVVWSDVRTCPECGTELVLWNVRDAGLRRLRCAACGLTAAKAVFRVVGERAVEANLSRGRGGRIVRVPTPDDLGEDRLPTSLPWFPAVPFGPERPMWRRGP